MLEQVATLLQPRRDSIYRIAAAWAGALGVLDLGGYPKPLATARQICIELGLPTRWTDAASIWFAAHTSAVLWLAVPIGFVGLLLAGGDGTTHGIWRGGSTWAAGLGVTAQAGSGSGYVLWSGALLLLAHIVVRAMKGRDGYASDVLTEIGLAVLLQAIMPALWLVAGPAQAGSSDRRQPEDAGVDGERQALT